MHKILYPGVRDKLSDWNEKTIQIYLSYLTGLGGSVLAKELKYAHETLYLSHLLSPSGFHLIGISWCIRMILTEQMSTIFWLSTTIYINFFIPAHPALQRSINFLFASSIYNYLYKSETIYSAKTLTIIFFMIDYFGGSYSLMPKSYIFSFIILGNLTFLPDNYSFLEKLFIAQIILSLISGYCLNPIGFLVGYIFAQLFTLIFISILIYIYLVPIKASFFSLLLEKFFIIYLQAISEIAYALEPYNKHLSTCSTLWILVYCIYKYHLTSLRIFLLIMMYISS